MTTVVSAVGVVWLWCKRVIQRAGTEQVITCRGSGSFFLAKEEHSHMRNSTDLSSNLNVRLSPVVAQALNDVCARLRLQRSEVARRALEEGLKTFAGVHL